MKLEQLCKILSTISQTKTVSAPLLATKLGTSLEEANKAIDILLILGVIKAAKIEKNCTTCPLSRLCKTTKTIYKLYIVDTKKLQELNKRCKNQNSQNTPSHQFRPHYSSPLQNPFMPAKSLARRSNNPKYSQHA